MGQVNVTVNGRSYSVGCDDGEEDHIVSLADFIDNRVTELTATVGQVGEARLLLMAGLLVADDLATAYDDLEALRGEIAELRANMTEAGQSDTALGKLTRRLEDIAARLESA